CLLFLFFLSYVFFFSSRRRHTRSLRDWSSDVCSSDLDMVEVMAALGHASFHVVGHDRGGRVGHRLARDHGKRVKTLTVLDISPKIGRASCRKECRSRWSPYH